MGDRDILRQLYAGELSRNSNYDFFARPAGKRLHCLYRRLVSLLHELMEPGCVARLQPAPTGNQRDLTLHISRMSYQRTSRLALWEAEFFLHEMGAAEHLPSPGHWPRRST